MALNKDNTLIITFKYRLLPTKRQQAALLTILESQRQLYNGAIEERIGCYRVTGKTRSRIDQFKALTELRKDCAFSALPLNLQRWTVRRVDQAYAGFFRRVKAKGKKAGFPRFRGAKRWSTFGFDEWKGITLKGNRLYFKGMPGGLRTHMHRSLPEGRLLSCTITRDYKGWYVCIQSTVAVVQSQNLGNPIGIDVGIKALATLSTGDVIPNPHVAKRAEREMRRRRRALARCRAGSRTRASIMRRVTALHATIANTRNTYLHQASARLIREHDLIAVEKLNVKGLASSILAKSVHDASWAKLKHYLAYKAVKAGRQFIEVDPRNTSQACSDCGCLVPKKLSERWHSCSHCGLQLDRDHNAALNVLHRAVPRPGLGNVGQWAKRSVGNIISPL